MNRNLHSKKTRIQQSTILLLTIVALFTLSACGNKGNGEGEGKVTYDGKNMHLELGAPTIFKNVVINDLKASVSLNGDDPRPLRVALDNTISGTLEDIEPGDYVLVISYYVERSLLQTTLATVTKNITVNSDQITVVTITDADLMKEIDDDNDGYTNLAEVRLNTNPHDPGDKPGEIIGFAVADSSSGDAASQSYRLKQQIGEAIVGNASSLNYEVQVGIQAQ